jgi:hypothetical protein
VLCVLLFIPSPCLSWPTCRWCTRGRWSCPS